MFQGKTLGDAIASAMALKAARLNVAKITQGELAAALGIKQPSVSELLKLGRLAKGKLPLLLDYFEDVVGPDHFGLPFSKGEMALIKALRKLPHRAQASIIARVHEAAAQTDALAESLGTDLSLADGLLPKQDSLAA